MCKLLTDKIVSLTVTVLFSIISNVNAQSPEVMWQKSFGGTESDEGNAVQQTADGGFIIFGALESSDGVDMWLLRTDSVGNVLWTKTVDFDELERCYDGLETFNGDFVMTGYTNSFGEGNYDVVLIRTDPSGDTLWTKIYGTAGYESGNAVFQTPNGGGFAIAGETGTTVTGQHDVYIVKTNPSGHLQWSQTIGGADDDQAFDIRQNSNDDYIITGYTKSFGAGDYDVWLICTDQSGNILWNKTFGGSQEDIGRAVVPTSDGGCAITGWTLSYGAGYTDVYLIRTNDSGDTLWTKTYGESSTYEAGYGLAKTRDGGFIITGTIISPSALIQNVLVIRTDSLGNVIWSKTIDDDGYSVGYCIRNTSDDGYIISGTIVPPNRTDTDVLLLCLGKEQITDVNEKQLMSVPGYELKQNFPNPFNPSTKISWKSAVSIWQTLKVYDVLGNEIAVLVDEFKPAGTYEIEFNAGYLPSGTYFYQLKSGDYLETRKMILLR